MRNFSPVNRYVKGARRQKKDMKMAPRELISIRASGRSFVDSCNFTNAAKWYTFEMENSADKARSTCHRGVRHASLKHFHRRCGIGEIFFSIINSDKEL